MKRMPLAKKVLLNLMPAILLAGTTVGCQAAAPALIQTLGNFEKPRDLRHWKGSEGVSLERASDKTTSGKSALRITTSAHRWATVSTFSISGRQADWHPYYWLKFDLFNATGDRKVIRVQTSDAKRTATVITGLLPGKNNLAIPVELLSALELTSIKGFTLSILAPGQGARFYLDNLKLERPPSLELSTSTSETGASPALVLDFSRLEKVAHTSAFQANVYLPLQTPGTIRIVKLKSTDKHATKLALTQAELKGCSTVPELTVSAFFRASDGWHVGTRTVVCELHKTTTITYSPFDFGY